MDAAQTTPLEDLRIRALRVVHEYMIEPFMGRGEVISTGGHQEITDLDVVSRNFGADYHYGPTPRLMIRWINDTVLGNKHDWTFVDIGAGRGRVMMEAATYPYKSVVGIELARELHEDAETNLAAMPKSAIKAGHIDNRLADATAFDVPEGPCVFYLANTLGGDLLKRFLDHVLARHGETGDPMVFFYMNPESPEVFAADDRLTSFQMPAVPRFKLNYLAPYRVVAFATRGLQRG